MCASPFPLARLSRLVAVGFLALMLAAPPLAAEVSAERLARALHLAEVVELLREEGLDYGKTLEADMLGGNGGAVFSEQVSKLYDMAAMHEIMLANLDRAMSKDDIAESLAFFETEPGQQILKMELSARRAMSDPAVEEAALAAFRSAASEKSHRAGQIGRFIEINDLNERNVSGALNSNYQFFVGLVEGGAYQLSDAEIIDEVWAQEEEIRASTRDWLQGFLFLAYSSLGDADMEAYLNYSASPAGQALNAALFDGFDEIYGHVYYGLGRAVALALKGTDL